MAKLKAAHEEEMKMQEQEAMEHITNVQRKMAEQTEEMKKFGDFIKIQSETLKQQQEKLNSQQTLITRYDAELAKERSQRQYIVDNMSMTEQGRVQLG